MLVIAGEVVGCFGSASITVDALIVHEEPTRNIIRPSLFKVCHR